MDFNSFEFHASVAKGVKVAGYVTPTPIQEQAIPAVMQGADVMGLAQTGTGKTAAFALPILHRLMQGKRRVVRALVVAPTRELAEQINDAINTLGRETGVRSITVYGGVNINPQKNKLKQGVEIVVACPGRLLDHIGQGTIDLKSIEVLVLDEADQMFDMGFFPDIRKILGHLPKQRQTLLFSATMPVEIRRLANEVLNNPVTVQVGNTAPATTVSHALYPVPQHLKTAMLMALLEHADTESVLVFTRTKHRAKRLGEQLIKKGYKAASLQGNLSQNRRQEALGGFRDGTFQILVATDIAARGIDVSQISHVINYDIPNTPEAYVHRIGRTGRAARTGDAFTLVSDDDKGLVKAIEKVLGGAIERRSLDGFDLGAPAPAKNKEFSRPPRKPAPGSRPKKAKAAAGKKSESGAGSKPAKATKNKEQAEQKKTSPSGEKPRRRRPNRSRRKPQST
ncbi:MAG TPA: DEAD/DEAH box helicase [Geopsychrobacteraceae bacterium]|nr:DEAD/DEAH box helicase [Geopsychrobacteraceae bacterium]